MRMIYSSSTSHLFSSLTWWYSLIGFIDQVIQQYEFLSEASIFHSLKEFGHWTLHLIILQMSSDNICKDVVFLLYCVLKCTFKELLLLKYFGYRLQWYDFSPEWVRKCDFNSPLLLKRLEHFVQEGGFSPVCTLKYLQFSFLSERFWTFFARIRSFPSMN